MNREELSPTTNSVLSLIADTPVIVLKGYDSSTRSERVFREFLSMSDENLLVRKDGEELVIVNKSCARRFSV